MNPAITSIIVTSHDICVTYASPPSNIMQVFLASSPGSHAIIRLLGSALPNLSQWVKGLREILHEQGREPGDEAIIAYYHVKIEITGIVHEVVFTDTHYKVGGAK